MFKNSHKSTFALFLAVIALSLFTHCTKRTNACFNYSPQNISTSDDVVFDASCSENAASYIWTFGDGTPDETTNSITTVHRYNTSGMYTVTLNIKRKDGVEIRNGEPTITQTFHVY